MTILRRFIPLILFALGMVWASPGFATKFRPLLADPESRDTDPAPSPDGKWLAFQSNRGGSSQIWIMSTEGGQLRKLTAEPESSKAGGQRMATRVMTPTWAPDGKSILYISTRGGQYNIYSIPFEGGESKPLSNAPGSQRFAVYSPDGSKICFPSSRLAPTSLYGFHLYVMDAKGEVFGPPAKRLTFSGASPGHPVWSFDGKSIAFVAKDYDTTKTVDVGGGMQTKQSAMFSQFRVFKIPAAGGKAVKLTGIQPENSEDTWPSWSPNGTQIAFGRNVGGKQSLWVVDVPTKKSFMLTGDGNCMKPTFSYDGNAIYYTKLDGTDEDIWVASDFTTAAPPKPKASSAATKK